MQASITSGEQVLIDVPNDLEIVKKFALLFSFVREAQEERLLTVLHVINKG